jgi:hypothetical protein
VHIASKFETECQSHLGEFYSASRFELVIAYAIKGKEIWDLEQALFRAVVAGGIRPDQMYLEPNIFIDGIKHSLRTMGVPLITQQYIIALSQKNVHVELETQSRTFFAN